MNDISLNEYEITAYENNEVFTIYAPNVRVLLAYLTANGFVNKYLKIKLVCEYANLIPNQKEL